MIDSAVRNSCGSQIQNEYAVRVDFGVVKLESFIYDQAAFRKQPICIYPLPAVTAILCPRICVLYCAGRRLSPTVLFAASYNSRKASLPPKRSCAARFITIVPRLFSVT